ncbi:MAG: hypothetical protein QNJ53_28800 [Pleurocapsa sp. MO_192.B19]|nr:hypothetical protein [Pleurocapsa sp. MO_192.B19]
MNDKFIGTLLGGALATSLLASVLLPTRPAAANDLLEDIGIGAAANLITGEILDNGSVVGNTVKGAATGAAVNATGNENNNNVTGTVTDAAVGAAANVVTGIVIDDGNVGDNAISGAAGGALLNLLR